MRESARTPARRRAAQQSRWWLVSSWLLLPTRGNANHVIEHVLLLHHLVAELSKALRDAQQVGAALHVHIGGELRQAQRQLTLLPCLAGREQLLDAPNRGFVRRCRRRCADGGRLLIARGADLIAQLLFEGNEGGAPFVVTFLRRRYRRRRRRHPAGRH